METSVFNPKEIFEPFYSEEYCRNYIFSHRWPEGFICPVCSSGKYWFTSRGLIICDKGHQTSITVGTSFEGTRIELSKWFEAVWYFIVLRKNVSARKLQSILQTNNYPTSWKILNRIRYAMYIYNHCKLSGRIFLCRGTIDDSYRYTNKEDIPVMLMAATMVDDFSFNYQLRLSNKSSNSESNIIQFDYHHNTPGVNPSIRVLSSNIKIIALNNSAYINNKRIVDVYGLVKKWMHKKYMTKINKPQIDLYLSEFAFRFSFENSNYGGKAFFNLINLLIDTPISKKSQQL